MMVRVTSNASNPPENSNGVLQNYTVRIYNELSDYSREFEIQPFSIDIRSTLTI